MSVSGAGHDQLSQMLPVGEGGQDSEQTTGRGTVEITGDLDMSRSRAQHEGRTIWNSFKRLGQLLDNFLNIFGKCQTVSDKLSKFIPSNPFQTVKRQVTLVLMKCAVCIIANM